MTGDDGPIALPRARERAVLAALALHHPSAVSPSALSELLARGTGQPASAQTIRSHISRLRATVGADLVTSGPDGYRLGLDALHIDVGRLEAVVADALTAMRAGDPDAAQRSARNALSLWRGRPYDELDGAVADAERARLGAVRRRALITAAEALSRMGRHPDGADVVAPECAAQPLDEELWSWLIRVLGASGRREEALARYDEIRGTLSAELGIDPGGVLRAARDEVLAGGSSTPTTAVRRIRVSYTHRRGRAICYTVIGNAGPPLVVLHGLFMPHEMLFEEPTAARFFERLGHGRRMVLMDLGGLGLSDPVGVEELTFADWAADVEAVMDAAHIRHTAVVGCGPGGAVALCAADRMPQRITRLALTALPLREGFRGREGLDEVLHHIEQGPGQTGGAAGFLAPSRIGDQAFVDWLDRGGERGASPSSARAFFRMMFTTDLTDVAARTSVPTLVIERPQAPAAGSAIDELVGLLPDCRYVTQPGIDALPFLGDSEGWLDEVLAFLTPAEATTTPLRLMAVAATRSRMGTVLLTAHDSPDEAVTAAAARLHEAGGAAVLHIGLASSGHRPTGPAVEAAVTALTGAADGSTIRTTAFRGVHPD